MPTQTDSTAAIAALLAVRERIDTLADECAAAGPPLDDLADFFWLFLEHIREEVARLSPAIEQ